MSWQEIPQDAQVLLQYWPNEGQGVLGRREGQSLVEAHNMSLSRIEHALSYLTRYNELAYNAGPSGHGGAGFKLTGIGLAMRTLMLQERVEMSAEIPEVDTPTKAAGELARLFTPSDMDIKAARGIVERAIAAEVSPLRTALAQLVHASEARENLKAQGITDDQVEKECWDAMKAGQKALRDQQGKKKEGK